MDALKFAGMAVGITSSVIQALEIFGRDARRQASLLRRSYPVIPASLIVFVFPDSASRFERIERDVLNGPEENALTFRQAITDECNMTAIAVSSSQRR